jgi:ribosome maturation factor RimP
LYVRTDYSVLFFYGWIEMELEISRTSMEQKLYDLSVEIIKSTGYELYDLEYIAGSSTLRVYIMDSETNSAVIEDCIAVDRAFTEPFEEKTWIPEDIVLEVSSPGVYREIKSEDHLNQAKGEYVQVIIRGDIDSAQFDGKLPKELKGKKFRGKVISFDSEKLKLELDKNEIEFNINIEQIKKINLDPSL